MELLLKSHHNVVRLCSSNEKIEVGKDVENHLKRCFLEEYALEDQQIFYSVLDQEYHSKNVGNKDFNLAKTSIDIQRNFEGFPDTFEDHIYLNFDHLFGYGAGYYSYLWSNEIASKIHLNSFKSAMDSWNLDEMRRCGESFKENPLMLGGSVEPWDIKWEKLLGGKEELNLYKV
jgi:intermediate peptidase